MLPSAQPTTLYDALSFDTVCHAMVPYMLCYAVYTMVPYTICAVYAMVPYTICAIFFSTKVFASLCRVLVLMVWCCFAVLRPLAASWHCQCFDGGLSCMVL